MVFFNDKVFMLKLFYIQHISRPVQHREYWVPLQLQLEHVNVVPVYCPAE
jgi:hypothetical protein